MLRWRRRKQGFEWREYVRTTILVRRKDRRQRIGEVGQAAAEGLKNVGQRGAAAGAAGAAALGRGVKVAGERGAAAGVVGAAAVGRGVKAAGERGAVWGAAGARATGDRLREGLPRLAEASRTGASILGAALERLWAGVCVAGSGLARVSAPGLAAIGDWLEPAFVKLRQPRFTVPLLIASAVSLYGALARIFLKGASQDYLIPLLVAVVFLGLLAAAHLSNGLASDLIYRVRESDNAIARSARNLAQLTSMHFAAHRNVVIGAALAVIVIAGWFLWRGTPSHSSAASGRSSGSEFEGRAVAASGDTIRINGTVLRLNGIEAPMPGQTCSAESSRTRDCGAAAESALAKLLRGQRVSCHASGTDDAGLPLATCDVGGKDAGAELVRTGQVFATTGFFAPYSSIESEARSEKIGIWRGETVRPSAYRAQRWEEARRQAPDGCPIKGDVAGGRRTYVLPWSKSYDRVRVAPTKGGRWFCSEAEAQAAGWQPYERS